MNNHNNIGGGSRKVETNGGNEDPLHTISLSIDETFEVLAHPERRAILHYLMDAPNTSIPIHDLVLCLTADSSDRADEPNRHDPKETRIYHSHLPKLADLGIVEYDDRSEEVRYYRDKRLESWLSHAITETDK